MKNLVYRGSNASKFHASSEQLSRCIGTELETHSHDHDRSTFLTFLVMSKNGSKKKRGGTVSFLPQNQPRPRPRKFHGRRVFSDRSTRGLDFVEIVEMWSISIRQVRFMNPR